ncbi:heptaprenylglyceryl phosphate synthase [Paenibacillus turpanensis]|uniref:heptaprenylglyceryl phosphate synthase n=1 Tax=Paenibacillus turpanensis TaxID=2689078 RepID=UPI001409E6EC|nr:heptaprenylglyceryl phosphate synthase [Paenibacillus turpanensis]
MALTTIRQWKHVFKLDPDKPISDDALDALCLSGTDAIVIGGSSGVTFDNTVDLMSRVRRYEVSCVLEVSGLHAIAPGFDLYLIPVVLNADSVDWVIGQHHQAVKEYGSFVPWESVAAEAYVILNPDCTAGRLTGASSGLSAKDVAAYAKLAERLYRFPVFYMEYSGMFGDMDMVRRARGELKEARLFYGGGINSEERAREALEAGADTIVVGNVIYESLEKALATVNAVKMG